MSVSGARNIALRCYNNAYYVCTLVLIEAKLFPELRVSDYVDKILEIEKNKYSYEICLATMAMACLLLAAYDPERYGRDSDMWKAIYQRCTHYQWYHSSVNAIFLDMMSGEYRITTPLSRTEFAPRDIIEAIDEVPVYELAPAADYICEAINRLNDPITQELQTTKVITQLRDYKGDSNLIFEEDLVFSSAIVTLERYLQSLKKYTSELPAYSEDHTQIEEPPVIAPHTSDTVLFQARIDELEKENTGLKEQLAQQVTRIKELETEVIPIKDLEADLEKLRKWKQLSRGQVALFCHALAEHCEFVQKTKLNDIAPMAHGLFGIGIKSAYNLMVSGYSKEDREHVAKIFETIWPTFADFILNAFDKKEQQLKQ